VPGDILQAEDRAHRVGQSAASVTVQFLLVKGSVDDIMWDVVQGKLDNVGVLLDGHKDSLQVGGAGEGGQEGGRGAALPAGVTRRRAPVRGARQPAARPGAGAGLLAGGAGQGPG
jgi:hypothetical protein